MADRVAAEKKRPCVNRTGAEETRPKGGRKAESEG
jgi:hypothetical protein